VVSSHSYHPGAEPRQDARSDPDGVLAMAAMMPMGQMGWAPPSDEGALPTGALVDLCYDKNMAANINSPTPEYTDIVVAFVAESPNCSIRPPPIERYFRPYTTARFAQVRRDTRTNPHPAKPSQAHEHPSAPHISSWGQTCAPPHLDTGVWLRPRRTYGGQ
jgi:hypothetical protein